MTKQLFRLFSHEDDALIQQMYAEHGDGVWSQLALKLGRENFVVVQRAFQLGLITFSPYSHVLLSHRRDGWRSDELDFVKKFAGKHPTGVLARHLCRSVSSVSKQLFELRLTSMSGPDWTDAEHALLQESLVSRGVSYIAKATGRTLIDVKHQILQLGLAHVDIPLTRFTGRRKSIRQECSHA